MTEQEPKKATKATPAKPPSNRAGETAAEADEAAAVGYAVYDDTLGQFVSGVFDSEDAALDAAEATPESHAITVRRV